MAYKILIRGVEVECQNAAEALELARLAASSGTDERPARRGPGRPPINAHTMRERKAAQDVQSTLDFLRLLQAAGNAGARSPQIVEALKLKGARGVGGALITVKRILRTEGFDPDMVFRMRGVRAARRWKAGSQLESAVAKIGGLIPQRGGVQ